MQAKIGLSFGYLRMMNRSRLQSIPLLKPLWLGLGLSIDLG